MVTTKKLHLKSIIYCFGFLNGDTNIQYLKDRGVRFGMNGANEQRDLDRLMSSVEKLAREGRQKIDQITKVIDQIRKNPDSRRHMVTAGILQM